MCGKLTGFPWGLLINPWDPVTPHDVLTMCTNTKKVFDIFTGSPSCLGSVVSVHEDSIWWTLNEGLEWDCKSTATKLVHHNHSRFCGRIHGVRISNLCRAPIFFSFLFFSQCHILMLAEIQGTCSHIESNFSLSLYIYID